uniref:Uncharacterized protein n=1 Tax=Leersia perrieri TaxID=77586 RepID=A0A0D9XV97_9ORYZ
MMLGSPRHQCRRLESFLTVTSLSMRESKAVKSPNVLAYIVESVMGADVLSTSTPAMTKVTPPMSYRVFPKMEDPLIRLETMGEAPNVGSKTLGATTYAAHQFDGAGHDQVHELVGRDSIDIDIGSSID